MKDFSNLVPGGLAVKGRFVRTGRMINEWYDDLKDPCTIIAELKSGSPPCDLFTFIQRPPDNQPTLPFHSEIDHVAAIPITTFDDWWNNLVSKKVRKNVRRSEKYGVQVRTIDFNDSFIDGILKIYREVPLRSGRPFKHFNDDFDTCRRKHATFLNRSKFIGAFLNDQLIGFIKLVFAGSTARTMQNIAMDQYRDLSPANAMIAQAVRLCVENGCSHLVYGKLAYGKRGNAGLEEFKCANGFQKLEFPRYYVPLSSIGRFSLGAGLHRDWVDFLPQGVFSSAWKMRRRWYEWRFARKNLPQAANVTTLAKALPNSEC